MNGKERAEYRKQANGLNPIFQIGKGDITGNMVDSIDEALEKRELIKLTVLETAGVTAKDAAEILSTTLGAEVIQCIGRKFVLFRKKTEDK